MFLLDQNAELAVAGGRLVFTLHPRQVEERLSSKNTFRAFSSKKTKSSSHRTWFKAPIAGADLFGQPRLRKKLLDDFEGVDPDEVEFIQKRKV